MEQERTQREDEDGSHGEAERDESREGETSMGLAVMREEVGEISGGTIQVDVFEMEADGE